MLGCSERSIASGNRQAESDHCCNKYNVRYYDSSSDRVGKCAIGSLISDVRCEWPVIFDPLMNIVKDCAWRVYLWRWSWCIRHLLECTLLLRTPNQEIGIWNLRDSEQKWATADRSSWAGDIRSSIQICNYFWCCCICLWDTSKQSCGNQSIIKHKANGEFGKWDEQYGL